MTNWLVQEVDGERSRECSSKSEAQEIKSDMEGLGMDVEIFGPKSYERQNAPNGEEKTDGGSNPAVIHSEVSEEDPRDESVATDYDLPEKPPEEKDLANELKKGVDTDPLDILPSYMIDDVQGTSTLNKRGLSVLAYHYGISVVERKVIVSPHESDWEYAIVETTVENEDGKTFVGSGTAHLDRGDDKGVLLEMAETRSYKRAVSFATGTGIVSYQEMVGELE